jgi:hypothetical protein
MMEDPAKVEEAKKRAAGAWGEKMSKFPLLFAKAAFYGSRPTPKKPADVNNGTVTLVDLGNGPMAVTCQHVIEHYRSRLKTEGNLVFQIGNVEIDPLAQLIDANRRIDIATIRLSAEQAKAVTSEGEIGSCIFKPKAWPSPMPKKDEYVCFGGFPGTLRTAVAFDELDFPSWSSGGSRISSVSELQFASAFEREYWVSSFGKEHHMELQALGGMSGGPALVHRGLYWDFVGIVTQHHENYDAIFFVLADRIRADGTINPPPV